jgi:hypothetical protein
MTPYTTSGPSTEKNTAVIKGSSRSIFRTILANKFVSPGPVGGTSKINPIQTFSVVRQTPAVFDRVQLALVISLTMVRRQPKSDRQERLPPSKIHPGTIGRVTCSRNRRYSATVYRVAEEMNFAGQ